MFGWCEHCGAIAIEGICSEHGNTKPLSYIAAVDPRPLTAFEKRFFNERMDDLTLGEGIFLLYSDRMFRRKVIFLDIPLVEIRLHGQHINIIPLAKGQIDGMSKDAFVRANLGRLNRMVKVSESFAQYELKDHKNAVISHSGGKDSTVLADILGSLGLNAVFINTKLEFPETYSFIHNCEANGHRIDEAKATTSFFSLVGEHGFPGHGNRWCCKTQKFEPFFRYISDHYGNQQVLVFSGERRWEGVYRLNEPLERRHRYITNQLTVQPLLDWLALDIWAYIWANALPVNTIYEYFDRAGCWLCPFGLEYRIFLLQFTHPKFYEALMKVRKSTTTVQKRPKTASQPPSCFEIHREPCTTMLDGKKVKTCDVYGHFFVNSKCFRCGMRGESTIKVPTSASV